MSQLLPFRSQKKVKALVEKQLVPPSKMVGKTPIYEYQPIPVYVAKRQRPNQEYMHVHGENTWMVDVAFIASHGEVIQATEGDEEALIRETRDKFMNIVLFCIHCNSRFVYASRLPARTGENIGMCLKWLSQHYPCDTIISDNDRAIINAKATVPRIRKHIVYNMSDYATTIHSALAIVDRFTRTFRDMLFNSKLTLDNNETLRTLIRIYNKTPHATLSRIMGFDVTPEDMIKNIELQHEFMRRIQAHNATVHDRISTAFNRGDIVYVYQPRKPFSKRRNTVEDDPYVIVGIHGGRYSLANLRTKQVIERPRNYLVRS